MVAQWTKIIIFVIFISCTKINGQLNPNITFIENAEAKGAVCLDGSPGGYYLYKGSGEGIENWIIYLEGGGWCKSKDDCLYRVTHKPELASNKNKTTKSADSILGANQEDNPDFYNWNRVFIPYCDGASYLADVEKAEPYYRRGARIFRFTIEELLEKKGMKNVNNAILAGNSAGGLATMLNCDRFKSFLPAKANVKCVADSGFFMSTPNQDQAFARTVAYHNLTDALPKSCTSKMDAKLCLTPKNFIGDIKTPLFVLNSDFDQFQLKNVWSSPLGSLTWYECTMNLTLCAPEDIKYMKEFREYFLKTLRAIPENPSRGLFINSCFVHDFLWRANWNNPRIQNKTISKAIGDWYFNRSQVRLIDDLTDSPIDCHL